MENSYYETLGVSKNAPASVVKAAYRALSQEFHPDKNPDRDTTRAMQLLNAAYAVLSDPDKRRSYDAGVGDLERRNSRAAAEASERERDRRAAAEAAQQRAAAERKQGAARAAERRYQAERAETERKREGAQAAERQYQAEHAEAEFQQARVRKDHAVGAGISSTEFAKSKAWYVIVFVPVVIAVIALVFGW